MADKVIALACAAGMSTSLLVSKMQKAAADNGKDYEIFAKSTADIDNMLAGTGSPKPDVLLLGPQVAFMKGDCLLYTYPSQRDRSLYRMPSSA